MQHSTHVTLYSGPAYLVMRTLLLAAAHSPW